MVGTRNGRSGGKLELRGGRKPKMAAAGRGAWSKRKGDIFLRELAATCNVSAAGKIAGITSGQVYRRRSQDAAFRAGWNRALAEGYARLELMMLERSLNGTLREVKRADGSMGTMREYPDRIALVLLKMHRDRVVEIETLPDDEEIEKVRARIARKLEIVRQRLEAKRAAAGEGQ